MRNTNKLLIIIQVALVVAIISLCFLAFQLIQTNKSIKDKRQGNHSEMIIYMVS